MCRVDDCAVFLDLRTNRYFTIPRKYFRVLSEFLSDPVTNSKPPLRATPTPEELALIETFSEQDLVRYDEPPYRYAHLRKMVPATSLAPSQTNTPVTTSRLALHGPRVLCSFTYVSVYLKLGRLDRLIERLSARRAVSPSASKYDVDVVLAIFRRIRTCLYTARDACLMDSLILNDFLHSFGHQSTLVIGVRTRPFSAHAWVQIGDAVVDDTVESVQAFTPILTV